MSDDPKQASQQANTEVSGVTRRRLLTTGAASAALGVGIGGGATLLWSQHARSRGPMAWLRPDRNGAPPVGGLHLQFGKNAGTEAVEIGRASCRERV